MGTRELIRQDILAYLNMLDTTTSHTDFSVRDYLLVRFKYPVFKFVMCMRICCWLEKKKF